MQHERTIGSREEQNHRRWPSAPRQRPDAASFAMNAKGSTRAAKRKQANCREAAHFTPGDLNVLGSQFISFPAFLIASASRLEFAATHTKQATKLFLIATETATFCTSPRYSAQLPPRAFFRAFGKIARIS